MITMRNFISVFILSLTLIGLNYIFNQLIFQNSVIPFFIPMLSVGIVYCIVGIYLEKYYSFSLGFFLCHILIPTIVVFLVNAASSVQIEITRGITIIPDENTFYWLIGYFWLSLLVIFIATNFALLGSYLFRLSTSRSVKASLRAKNGGK